MARLPCQAQSTAEVRAVREDEADVIVLGLGGIGSAAAYWLARGGARVIGLEQFELGHDRGASQDHSRIIRLSYHDAAYVRLAQAAYASWDEVAAEAGARARDQDGRASTSIPSDATPSTARLLLGSMDAARCRTNASTRPRRCGAIPELRIDDGPRSCSRSGAASPRRRARTPRTSAWRARTAPTCGRTRASRRSRRPAARSACASAGGRSERRSWSSAPGRGRTTSLALLDQRLNLDVTREQVIYLEPQDASTRSRRSASRSGSG